MRKNLGVLLVGMLVNMGIGLIMPITTLYLHNQLQQKLIVAGNVLLAFSLAMVLGNLLGGWLFDNWRIKLTHYLGGAIVGLNLLLLFFFPLWPWYALFATCYGWGLGILNSAVNGYIALRQKCTPNLFTQEYWLANLGMGLATFLSGVLYAVNVRWVFGVAFVLFFLAFVIIKFSFHELKRPVDQTKNQFSWRQFTQLPLKFWFICCLLIIIWIGYEQWNSNVSVYMLQKGISVQKYSLLFTISTFEIVLLQPLLGIFFRPTFKNEKWRILLGSGFFAVSYLSLLHATAYPQFILGITLLSLGDILTLTTTPATLNRFATDQNRATIQALGSTAGSLGRALGPLLGSALIELSGFDLTFLLLFAAHLLMVLLGSCVLRTKSNDQV
ncbi:MFS transporter [Liquorilactobacillus sicerae]|uniref:MFS transporter n=1 Tax=Liquorilactobacillus sicerae TaxID=1416943 RepID=UPI0024800DE4|nr:MFS transporter [Liquorilactobacillus sicerae]